MPAASAARAIGSAPRRRARGDQARSASPSYPDRPTGSRISRRQHQLSLLGRLRLACQDHRRMAGHQGSMTGYLSTRSDLAQISPLPARAARARRRHGADRQCALIGAEECAARRGPGKTRPTPAHASGWGKRTRRCCHSRRSRQPRSAIETSRAKNSLEAPPARWTSRPGCAKGDVAVQRSGRRLRLLVWKNGAVEHI
jgi:hypothetical protein